jgi:sulfatase maturation enzyme AslB (radical SAM superfamily)
MQDIRIKMLDGDAIKMCSACHYEESNKKVSGRQRQLLKSAITLEQFDKSFCVSPHFQLFNHSYSHHGHTTKMPVDLQIDLGNTCNSSCIMCSPVYSSKLASDYKKLAAIEPTIFKKFPATPNWADNSLLVDKLIGELSTLTDLKYIHFLGGETLYLKSFYTICNRLIDLGIAKDISIGTTTNCTVYTPELEHIIRNFKHVHLGLSIETFHKLNDYIRWPSKIDSVTTNIKKFMQLRAETNLHLSLRITPNVLSIYHIDSLFEYMIANKITAESCNILHEPSYLRPELLPKDLAQDILTRINAVIEKYNIVADAKVIINRRDENLIDPVIAQLIAEYKHILENYRAPLNIEQGRFNLVKSLKAFEELRGNTILDYLPEYEEFLRSYGY